MSSLNQVIHALDTIKEYLLQSKQSTTSHHILSATTTEVRMATGTLYPWQALRAYCRDKGYEIN